MSRIFMRFPEGRKKAVTLSYDDAVRQDARLIEIMRSNGLKGTFNINSGLYPREPKRTNRMPEDKVRELYMDSGMEVAAHGLNHTFLTEISEAQCCYEVLKDKENLENMFQKIVRGLAYPNGAYNDKVVACLKSAGIVYARTTISTEKFRIPTDWLRMETTCHHKNPKLMELARKFVEAEVKKESQLFYLWGHSYEFDYDDNWNVIESFAEYVGNREDIWYATNIEVYEYVEAYRSLVSSANGDVLFNPTAYVLYFENRGNLFCIHPGETLRVV